MADPGRVLKLVNMARGTYGAAELGNLLPGEPLSASFCPLGRSLRNGVGDWLFVAVGTRHLRLWTFGKDSGEVARGILAAWRMPHHRIKKSADGSGVVIIPLPSELSEFVSQFDHGLLPDYQDEVEGSEVRRLNELARNIPWPRGQRKAGSGDGAQQAHLSSSQAKAWQKPAPPVIPGI